MAGSSLGQEEKGLALCPGLSENSRNGKMGRTSHFWEPELSPWWHPPAPRWEVRPQGPFMLPFSRTSWRRSRPGSSPPCPHHVLDGWGLGLPSPQVRTPVYSSRAHLPLRALASWSDPGWKGLAVGTSLGGRRDSPCSSPQCPLTAPALLKITH